LSAWSSRQSPCLQHHVADSSSTEQDILRQLQQQLHIRRKARQAAVEAAQRRQKRKDTGSSNADSAEDSADQHSKGAGKLFGSSWQGLVVWATVLLVVGQWCVFQRKTLLIVPVVAAAATVYGVSRGLLLPNEAAVQQLAAVLDANQGVAAAVSVTGPQQMSSRLKGMVPAPIRLSR
jgi:hypothetical protein